MNAAGFIDTEREALPGGRGVRVWIVRYWKSLLGSLLGIGVVAWLFSSQDPGTIWRAFTGVDAAWLLPVVPLMLANMSIRAVRWSVLIGRRSDARFGSLFSALMVGYLANNFLPARGGDLVRVYALGNKETLARSRILATVVVERILDMGTIVFVFALAAAQSPLPDWMRHGGMVLAGVTMAGAIGLVILSLYGAWLIPHLVWPAKKFSPGIGGRLEIMAGEFTAGVDRFRHPAVAGAFFVLTAAIWVCEIGLLLIVGRAFGITLTPLDGLCLMLFSLFSSLIPALPGQLGTFELAMSIGLDFLGHSGAAGLAFALGLHLMLLLTTSVIGALCLAIQGAGLLLPPRLTGDELKVAPSTGVG